MRKNYFFKLKLPFIRINVTFWKNEFHRPQEIKLICEPQKISDIISQERANGNVNWFNCTQSYKKKVRNAVLNHPSSPAQQNEHLLLSPAHIVKNVNPGKNGHVVDQTGHPGLRQQKLSTLPAKCQQMASNCISIVSGFFFRSQIRRFSLPVCGRKWNVWGVEFIFIFIFVLLSKNRPVRWRDSVKSQYHIA